MDKLLNHQARDICQTLIASAEALRVQVKRCESGATIIDCGIQALGGLEAGRMLAEVCLAGLGSVAFSDTLSENACGIRVSVATDHPVAACLASQYAGWQISVGKFFAMGSGPMRAAANKEKLFTDIGLVEEPEVAVGILEGSALPTREVCEQIAADCRVAPQGLYLLIAPTSSMAGSVQVVARSVETALHKMHELGFPLDGIRSGFGRAPFPPVAADDWAGFGRTNDAVLYGGRVSLWVDCKDEVIESLGPRIPSCASDDFGRPFYQIFQGHDCDFYRVDPHLFSPAMLELNNLKTGRRYEFGKLRYDILEESFGL